MVGDAFMSDRQKKTILLFLALSAAFLLFRPVLESTLLPALALVSLGGAALILLGLSLLW